MIDILSFYSLHLENCEHIAAIQTHSLDLSQGIELTLNYLLITYPKKLLITRRVKFSTKAAKQRGTRQASHPL